MSIIYMFNHESLYNILSHNALAQTYKLQTYDWNEIRADANRYTKITKFLDARNATCI